MRLRTFTAGTLHEAMALVRREMGADAVIIATHDAPGGGVEVRAAAERAARSAPREKPQAAIARREAERKETRGDEDTGLTRIAQALHWHRLTERAARGLIETAADFADDVAGVTLARAIEARYVAHPIEPVPRAPILFSGPPGGGKTSVVARIAARCRASGGEALLIGADAGAGGFDQLRAYGQLLNMNTELAESPRAMAALLRNASPGPVLIDGPPVNPFDLEDLDETAELADAAGAEIVAVLEGGADAADAEDVASLFGSIGAGRVVVTKLDAARRLGGLVAAGEGGLAYAQIAASPFIGAGLAPATPLRLARALLEDVDPLDEDAGDEEMNP